MARILVVDDDDEHRLMLCTMLANEGHEAHGCGDPAKASVLVVNFKPDLAILDYQMPGLTGTELLSQLRELDCARRLPVILLSAIDAIRFSAQVAPSPHTRFLQKPVQRERLNGTITDLLGSTDWPAQS